MKKDNLTPYDKFVMNKKNTNTDFHGEKNAPETEKKKTPKFSSAYSRYIEKQIRRTEPSDEKVMTQEEFARQNEKGFLIRKNAAAVITEENNSTGKNVRFKKFGKVMLFGYVIIMIALALVVVVKTTTVDNSTSADASDAYVDNGSKIERMQDEEPGESGNWFDSLCDSLK